MAEHATLAQELERRRLEHRADRLRRVLDALGDRCVQRARNAKGLHEAQSWFRRELARVTSRQAELERLSPSGETIEQLVETGTPDRRS